MASLQIAITGTPFFEFHSDTVEDSIVVSPDNRRVAYARARSEDEWRVVLDGRKGKEYEGLVEGSFCFSPDSRRFAYFAVHGESCQLVLDGVEGPGYEDNATDSFHFSPDGRRYAYAAGRDGRSFAVIDGVESPPFDNLIKGNPDEVPLILFSPDGRRVLYVGRRGDERVVVLDGREVAAYENWDTPAFSPNGKHLAYMARRGGRWLLVLDGKEHAPAGETLGDEGIRFSPDGKHLAYVAGREDHWSVVLDGKPFPPYKAIKDITFSPDSQHLAYLARRGDQWLVVTDGREGKPYEGLAKRALVFSPDSRRLAYVAVLDKGKHCRVVADGKEGKAYNDLVVSSLAFSRDGRWLLYSATGDQGGVVVVDGVEGNPYEGIDCPCFSPDGRHVAYQAVRAERERVVVDRVEKKLGEFGSFLAGSRLVFDGPTALHTLVVREGQVLQLAITIGAADLRVYPVQDEPAEEEDAPAGPAATDEGDLAQAEWHYEMTGAISRALAEILPEGWQAAELRVERRRTAEGKDALTVKIRSAAAGGESVPPSPALIGVLKQFALRSTEWSDTAWSSVQATARRKQGQWTVKVQCHYPEIEP